MNLTILIVLIILTLLMSYKNFKRINEYKKDKTYIDLYTKVLRGEDTVHDELKDYIEKETDPCLNTKARIVKAYDDLLLEKNPSEELKDIDFKNIFYVNGGFSSEKAKLNSEIFVWLTLMLSKARCLSMIDLMNELYSKVSDFEEDLKVLVEYQVFKSAYNSLLEKGTDGIEFLKKLLSGDYGDYLYDKNLIGIYKKIACCLLVFTGEPLDETDEEMLPEFTGTLVGNRFTRDLEIYDDYVPKEENTDNTQITEPVNEDKKEDEEVSNKPSKETTEPSTGLDKESEEVEENIETAEKEVEEEIKEEPKTVEERTEKEVQASIENAENELLNSLSMNEDIKE